MPLSDLLPAPPGLFASGTRLYALDTPPGMDTLLVERFVGVDALSSLYAYQIDCLSTNAHIALKSLLGKQAALRTRLADGSVGTRSGYISAAAQLGCDGGFARYRVTLSPWLVLAAHQRRSRVFQDATLLDIVAQVLAAYRPLANWRATPDAEAFLAGLRPRSYCCQYRETDYAFLCRLLAEEGIGFCFEEAEDDGHGAARQRLVLFADAGALAEDASAAQNDGIRLHRNAAVEQADAIQTLCAERQLCAASTTVASWDYKARRVMAASLPAAAGAAAAPQVESYDWAGAYAFANQPEAERYARLLREAADARSSNWSGSGSVRTFRAGTRFVVSDAQPAWLHKAEAASPGFTLLAVQHAGINNLHAGLRQEAGTRLGAPPAFEPGQPHAGSDRSAPADPAAWPALLAAAEITGYANRFTALDAAIPWRPALDDGTGLLLNPKPTAFGSQTALVVGPDGSTANAGTVHTDHLGRIRIRFHWQQEEQHTCWVRVAQLFAGPGYGAQFIPRIGQEVLVRFLDNDIDRPLVAGVLYNGRGQDDEQAYAQACDHARAAQDNKVGGASPAWHGAAAQHGHAGNLSGFKSAALGADGYGRQSNQLVFDDSSGRLRTMLATDTAATQLNLGHLIHQADNYRGSFRGTGWELRTDAYGAIRAGKGVLLTTCNGGTDRAPLPAGDNATGITLLRQAKTYADAMNRAAAAHQTVQFILVKGGALNGSQAQSRLDEKRAPLDAMLHALSGMVDARDGGTGGQGEQIPQMHAPLVVVTAQAGIGVTAAEGVHIAAGEVAHFAAGRDFELAAGDALSIHSGQAIGLLAGVNGEGGIKLYAGQGDVQLQAHSDAMSFAAKEAVRIASANSHVDFAAAKSITLCTAGGASLTIEGGNITFACPGTLSVKAASKSFGGPARMNPVLPKFPNAICKRCKRNAAAAGAPFSLVEE